MLREKLRGVVGFPVTPFQMDLSLDLAALESNILEMIRHPFCSLVAAGGTGEMYSMTPSENVEVVRRTVAVVDGKVPVIGGVGFSVRIAADMAREMERAGADGLLVMPPYYVNAPTEGLLEYYRGTADPVARRLSHELNALRREQGRLINPIPEAMVMKELPQHRPCFVHPRGNPKQRGEPVEPSTPQSILPFPKDAPRDRLGFARWLVSREHPLTARVEVNRLWQLIFGRGLLRNQSLQGIIIALDTVVLCNGFGQITGSLGGSI